MYGNIIDCVPLADFERREAEEQKYLDKLPKCSECGEPIQDDYYYLIDDEIICLECLNDIYRHEVEID